MRRTAAVGLALTSCLALAACGGSTLRKVATEAQTATSARTSTTSAPSGLASAPTREVLAASAAALAKVRTYHVESVQIDDEGRSSISADVSADGRFRGRLRMGRQQVDVVALGSATYLRANRAYWDEIGGPKAPHLSLLTDRWVKAPAAAAGGLRDTLDKLQPDHMAMCLRKSSTAQGVVNEGERRWRGQPVIVLRDPGRAPGSSPSALYTAARGAPLPLRETQSGPRRPGGRADRECGDPRSTTRRGETVYSDYDKPVRIEAPPNALDLDRLVAPKDLTPA